MQRAGMFLALFALALPQALLAQETVKKKYERDVITREEIQERAPDAKSAYDVIQRLRPQFLFRKGRRHRRKSRKVSALSSTRSRLRRCRLIGRCICGT